MHTYFYFVKFEVFGFQRERAEFFLPLSFPEWACYECGEKKFVRFYLAASLPLSKGSKVDLLIGIGSAIVFPLNLIAVFLSLSIALF